MADKEQEKSTEQVPEIDAPAIEISEETASGVSVEKDCKKKGLLESIADTLKNVKQSKRSNSTSPKTLKDESHVENESSKGSKMPKQSPSPSKKGLKDTIKQLFKSTGGKECKDETDNLCEADLQAQSSLRAKDHLPQLELDMGLGSTPSPKTENVVRITAAECVTHNQSSDLSSVPSGYSSLIDDDAMSLDDAPPLEDDQQKSLQNEDDPEKK